MWTTKPYGCLKYVKEAQYCNGVGGVRGGFRGRKEGGISLK